MVWMLLYETCDMGVCLYVYLYVDVSINVIYDDDDYDDQKQS